MDLVVENCCLCFLTCAGVFVLQEQLSFVEEEWKVIERVKEPGLTAVVRKYPVPWCYLFAFIGFLCPPKILDYLVLYASYFTQYIANIPLGLHAIYLVPMKHSHHECMNLLVYDIFSNLFVFTLVNNCVTLIDRYRYLLLCSLKLNPHFYRFPRGKYIKNE